MFAGSYFSILLTLTVVQISAVGGKKKHKTKQFAMFLIPLKSNKRAYQSRKAQEFKYFIYVFSSIILIKSGHKAKRIFTLTRTSSSLHTYSTLPWDPLNIFLPTVTSRAENWVTYFMTGMNSSFCLTQRFRDRFTIAEPHCKFHRGVSADVTL